VKYFEEKGEKTITEYALLNTKMKVCVAVSGGKDSLTILSLLKKFGYTVSGLLVDEGIADYREHTIVDAKAFCEKQSIPLDIVTFKELTGKDLDDMLVNKKLRACTVCGTFRRHLLNQHAHGFDVIATGHNADDEAQVVLMNILRAQTNLLNRSGPKTTSTESFVQRIKPLYFCTEKEIMTYALIKGFAGDFTECPNAKTSYRARVRDLLNAYEAKHPGSKQKVLKKYLRLHDKLPREQTPIRTCTNCSGPTTGETCASCKMLVTIN
jgi:uncharacterized protein (TIGR00269 family)